MRKRRLILLDAGQRWRKRLGPGRAVVCKRSQEIAKALAAATGDWLWISSGAAMTDELLRAVSRSGAVRQGARRRWAALLTLKPPRPAAVAPLRSLFRQVVGETDGFRWLRGDQLCEVLAGDEEAAGDVFIGGAMDTQVGLLTLVRGNLERVTVPLSIFRPSATSQPDFRRFELDDYGHTVRLGDYEASADFVLYEVDAEYRKRRNAKRRGDERGFGPSLRRLRILKRVPQGGFAGLSARTIGRIERGEVRRPHGATLAIISRTLGVPAEEIETY